MAEGENEEKWAERAEVGAARGGCYRPRSPEKGRQRAARTRRQAGEAHKAAEPEEHGRRTRSCSRAAAAPRLLSASLCLRVTRHRGGERNMTEVGKKRILVLVDVLCVFVGELSALGAAAAAVVPPTTTPTYDQHGSKRDQN